MAWADVIAIIVAGSAGECRTTAWADVITIAKWVD
jgi:hypothetical protein